MESGTVTRGDEVVIAPTKKKARVEAIFIDEKNVSNTVALTSHVYFI